MIQPRDAFRKSILKVDFGKSAQQLGLKRDLAIDLFFNGDGKLTQLGNGLHRVPADGAPGTLQCETHYPPLNQDY